MVKLFPKGLVVSLCGTFLKPEMQSVYRQITGLQRYRTVVFTEKHLHADLFPFEAVVTMQKPPPEVRTKLRQKRQRGNFLRRFYYKHLLKQWPPPQRPKPPEVAPPTINQLLEPYDLVPLLCQHRPALVHVYYGHKAAKYLSMLKRWGGPFVVSFHGLDVTEGIYKPGRGASLHEVFEEACLILGRSQSLLDRLADLGCPPEKLRLNRAGVPVERFPRALRHPPEDGRWVLLQACRLIAKKGLGTSLEAFREVAARYPAARLVIAGNGPMEDELRTRAANLGLCANVTFAGWCSPSRLLDLYASAHLFLHPSETTSTGDREGVPNSLLEAMASGLPAVGTLHGGIPEAVTHGLDGSLVPECSPSLLASAIFELLADIERFRSYSSQAPASIDAKFGAKRQIMALEDCYTEAITSKF